MVEQCPPSQWSMILKQRTGIQMTLQISNDLATVASLGTAQCERRATQLFAGGLLVRVQPEELSSRESEQTVQPDRFNVQEASRQSCR